MQISAEKVHQLFSEHEDYIAFENRDSKLVIYMGSPYATKELENYLASIGKGDIISVISCRRKKNVNQ